MGTDEAKKIVENITDSITKGKKQDLEESTREIVKKAAQAVNSLKETEFDIRFNPDVFSPGIRHGNLDSEQFQKEKQLIKDAAEFLVVKQVPSYIRECLDHVISPMDGVTLVESLHARGINVRYLGKIAEMLSLIKPLEYLFSITISELISRATKHIFVVFLQNTEMMSSATAVSHFLNCFLYSGPVSHPQTGVDNLQSKNAKRRNKKKGRVNRLVAVDNNDWANLTPKSLWSLIRSEIKSYYDWELTTTTAESTCAQYLLQRVSLLRSFCLKNGVQLLLQEYNFHSKNKLPFFEEDILNIFPNVKHVSPRASDAYNMYTAGQNKIEFGHFKEGYDLINEALNLLNNVYGAVHPELAQCLRMLARLSYIMGDYPEAMLHQQKAVLISERVNSIDHPSTITEYIHLALYCFANSHITVALKLVYRARYLLLLTCGENHPEVALLDNNISLMLHAIGEYEVSLKFLESALDLNNRIFGSKSLKVAVSHHLIARTQSCMGDFRSALANEKETYAIYKSLLGDEHHKTEESSECLRQLTHQAVVLQKKMNEICTCKSNFTLPSIQIVPPSMGNVLEMLNIINGIPYVHITTQNVEKNQSVENVAGKQWIKNRLIR